VTRGTDEFPYPDWIISHPEIRGVKIYHWDNAAAKFIWITIQEHDPKLMANIEPEIVREVVEDNDQGSTGLIIDILVRGNRAIHRSYEEESEDEEEYDCDES
jgi:hypothetical protein